MLDCRIVKYRNGEVVALNQDGTPSKLFKQALDYTGDLNKALDLWQTAYTDDFLSVMKDNRDDSATLDDVLKYLDTKGAVESPGLSSEELSEVISAMQQAGYTRLSKFYADLVKVFKPNGVLEFDGNAALKTKVFSVDDIYSMDLESVRGIISAIEKQGMIADLEIEKVKGYTDMYDSSSRNIIGASERISEKAAEETIMNDIEDFSDINQINTAIDNSIFNDFYTGKKREALVKKLSGMTRVKEAFILPDGTLSIEDNSVYDEVYNTLPSDVTFDDLVEIKATHRYLNEISDETWSENLEQSMEVVKEIEEEVAKLGVDIIGLSQASTNKTEVVELLDSLINLLEDPTNKDLLNTFTSKKQALLPSKRNGFVVELPSKYKGYNVVRVNTDLSATEMFDKHSLLKISDNLYHIVNTSDKAALYEHLYQRLADKKLKGVKTDVKDKAKAIKDIQAYIMTRNVGFETSKQEDASLAQVVFEHEPLAERTDFNSVVNIKTNEEYLKSDFIPDFYKYILEEKLKNSALYRNVLSAFVFSSNDISLSKPIDSLEGMRYSTELKDYFAIKKDAFMNTLSPSTGSGVKVTLDVLAVNKSSAIKEYQGHFHLSGGYLVVDTNDDVVKQGGIIYKRAKGNVYAPIKQDVDSPIYYSMTLNAPYNEAVVDKILKNSNLAFTEKKSTVKETKEKSKVKDTPKPIPPSNKQLTKYVAGYLKDKLGANISILSAANMAKELAKRGYNSLKGMIIGEKGANNSEYLNNKLNEAKAMLSKGIDVYEIESATGWAYRNNQWKYFSPEVMKLFKYKQDPNTLTPNVEYNLEDVLESPELFKLYPQLKNQKIIFTDGSDERIKSTFPEDFEGSWRGETLYVNINVPSKRVGTKVQTNVYGDFTTPNTDVDVYGRKRLQLPRNVLILGHELMHAVQSIEGFPAGGDFYSVMREGFRRLGIPISNSTYNNDNQDLITEAIKNSISKEDVDLFTATLDTFKRIRSGQTPEFKYYNNLEVEVEARFIEYALNNGIDDKTYTELRKEFEDYEGINGPYYIVGQKLQFLSANDKVYGFYDEKTGEMFLTEDFLDSKALLHEHWHMLRPGLKKLADNGDIQAKLLLDTFKKIVDDAGVFDEAAFIARYNSKNATGQPARFFTVSEEASKNNEELRQSLINAKNRLDNGEPLDDIEKETGWIISNGKWVKFDKGLLNSVNLRPNVTIEADKVYSPSDILDADKLFELYPRLKETKIKFFNEESNEPKSSCEKASGGFYRDGVFYISLARFSEASALSTEPIGTGERDGNAGVIRTWNTSNVGDVGTPLILIHELTHFIQDEEGLPSGGDHFTVYREALRKLGGLNLSDVNGAISALSDAILSGKLDEASLKMYEAAFDVAQSIRSVRTPNNINYLNLEGEIEARFTELVKKEGLKGLTYSKAKKAFMDQQNIYNSFVVIGSKGNRFSIIGEKGAEEAAKKEEYSFRLTNLFLAKEMAENGEDSNKIKLATGWESVNGEWMYEAEDIGFTEDFIPELGVEYSLGDIVNNNEFFEAYPQFKNIKVIFNDKRENLYRDGVIKLDINGRLTSSDKKGEQEQGIDYGATFGQFGFVRARALGRTLNHELVHAVQQEENYFIGGSPETTVRKGFILAGVSKTDTTGEINAKIEGKLNDQSLTPQDRRVLNTAKLYTSGFVANAVQDYNDLAGEVLARSIESRMDLTPSEKQQILIKDSQDVSDENQIFLREEDFSTDKLSSEVYDPRPGESQQDYLDRMREEIEANLLGDNSEAYFERIATENNLDESQKKTFKAKLKSFIERFSDWLAKQLGFQKMTPKQAAKLTTKDFLDRVTTSMLRGDFSNEKTALASVENIRAKVEAVQAARDSQIEILIPTDLSSIESCD